MPQPVDDAMMEGKDVEITVDSQVSGHTGYTIVSDNAQVGLGICHPDLRGGFEEGCITSEA